NSFLSSRPTTKKKIASSPSAAQEASGSDRPSEAGPNVMPEKSAYASRQGELAQASPRIAPVSSTIPAKVSEPSRARYRASGPRGGAGVVTVSYSSRRRQQPIL